MPAAIGPVAGAPPQLGGVDTNGNPQNPGSSVPGTTPAAPNPGATTFYGANVQQAQNSAQGSANAGTALNQYTAGQQALQAQIPQTLQGVLNGTSQIPNVFTAPPIAFKALNESFNQNIAPGDAATYGAGSPQLYGQQANANEQLAAQLYQTGQHNYLDYINSASNTAFNPVGQQTAQTAQQNNWQAGNQNIVGYQTPDPLGALGVGGAAVGAAGNIAGSVLSGLSGLTGH